MRSTPWAVTADGLAGERGERRSAQLLGRFVVRERGTAFWATLWAAAVAAELVAIAPAISGGGPAPPNGPDVVFILAAGSFMACG